jgi:hypothetical protein
MFHPVAVRVICVLQLALYDNHRPPVEISVDKFRLLPPADDVDKIRFLVAAFAVLPIDGNPKTANSNAALCVSEFRVCTQPTH